MASFSDLDTLRQMGLVSLIYNGNHQLCLKFSCAGTGITFTGSMDSALIIAAIKQQMTVDNIGLHGMVGPMGGMMTEYVPLPTVTKKSAQPFPNNSYINLSAGSESDLYVYDSGSYRALGYDSNNLYSIYGCYSDTYYGGQGWIRGVLFDTVISQNLLKAKNITGSTIPYIDYFSVAVCSSNLATVITVYNSSNNPYNAFKYISDGTDYYYVLDGTQTDWTDDLSGIGYKTSLDLIVGMSIDNTTGELIAVTFDYPLEENYWNTRVKSAGDKELLRNLGLWVDYADYLYGSVLNTSSYQYEIIEIYTGIGEGVAPFNLSDFYIPDYQKLSLGCTGSYSTPVKSWKLRITPITPTS